VVCNTGVRVTPRIDGEIHHFAEQGLYDGLFIMRDEESGTFLDHITGEAVYGPLVGTMLPIENLRQSTAGQAVAQDPATQVAISDGVRRELGSEDRLKLGGLLERVTGTLSDFFSSTVEAEDDRLPTMDLGLGVWEGDEARYYSYERLTASDNVIRDEFAGRDIVVYLDPAAFSMTALELDVEGYEWDVRGERCGAYRRRGTGRGRAPASGVHPVVRLLPDLSSHRDLRRGLTS